MDSDDEDTFPPKRSSLAGFVTNPQLRKLCSPGFGQIYWIQPLVSKSKSNGYIGQNTTSLFQRLQCHVAPSNRCIKLQRAFKTHGLDKFTVCLLEEDIPIDKLNDAEMKWIAKLDTWKNGYNCGPGGSPANVFKDPEVYARHIASHNTIDYRTKASKRAKDQHARPGERERKIARIKAQHQDPIKKTHHIDGLKKGWVKRKANGNTLSISVSGKAVWANPEYHSSTTM